MSFWSGLRRAVPTGGAAAAPARPRVEPTLEIRAQNSLQEYGSLEDALAAARFGYVSDSGVEVSLDTAARFAAVAACLRVKADDLSSLPLIVYRREGERRVPASESRVYALLKDRPNEWQTSVEFRQLQERRRLTSGFAPALIVRNSRGEPDELLPLDPKRCRPKQDDRTLAVTFEWTRQDGRRVELRREEVFCVWYASHNGVEPLSPVRYFRDTIGDGVAMRKHGSAFFANGAQPGMVLMAEQKMDPQSKTNMREDWDARFSGDRKFGTAVLDLGVKAEAVSISNEDAQYIESRKFNRSEVCGIYGVPPHRIGDLERATFTNIEHQSLEYVIYGLTPDLVKWEQAIGRDLLPEGSELYAKHRVDALLRGDSKSRAETLQIQRRNGVISPNEWRALNEMNPREDEGGDSYIVESNMRPDDGQEPPRSRQGGSSAPDNGGSS